MNKTPTIATDRNVDPRIDPSGRKHVISVGDEFIVLPDRDRLRNERFTVAEIQVAGAEPRIVLKSNLKGWTVSSIEALMSTATWLRVKHHGFSQTIAKAVGDQEQGEGGSIERA